MFVSSDIDIALFQAPSVVMSDPQELCGARLSASSGLVPGMKRVLQTTRLRQRGIDDIMAAGG